MTLYITGDTKADGLLNSSFDALLIGMLLDQQVPLEWAFRGPRTMHERLGHLDPIRIAAMDDGDVVAAACAKPAIHRFPAVMARRIHAVSVALTHVWGGRTEAMWADGCDAATLTRRLRALPGFGMEKTQIFVALLAKRFDVRPDGWAEAAGVFSDHEPRTIADCADEQSLAAVRAWKAAQKAAGKDKQGRPSG